MIKDTKKTRAVKNEVMKPLTEAKKRAIANKKIAAEKKEIAAKKRLLAIEKKKTAAKKKAKASALKEKAKNDNKNIKSKKKALKTASKKTTKTIKPSKMPSDETEVIVNFKQVYPEGCKFRKKPEAGLLWLEKCLLCKKSCKVQAVPGSSMYKCPDFESIDTI